MNSGLEKGVNLLGALMNDPGVFVETRAFQKYFFLENIFRNHMIILLNIAHEQPNLTKEI